MRILLLLLLLASSAVGCARRHVADTEVARGEEIFLRTPAAARAYVPTSAMACGHCHSHPGRLDHALSLAGVADRYPKMMERDGRVNTLQDRIRGCFLRSENGLAPPDDSPEMLALVAWIKTQSASSPAPPSIVSEGARRPMNQLDREHGRRLYAAQCSACHGVEGQGAGAFPPLWGPRSYNDGAGMARVYTLAAFIHNAMPLARGGTISEDDALHIAAFVNAQPRPVFEAKKNDYPSSKPPVDAVYYAPR